MNALQCGYVGSGWSTDRNVYLRECRPWTSEDTPGERNAARATALNRCDICVSYAKLALEQDRENLRFSCGAPGRPIFGMNQLGHYNYCQSTWETSSESKANLFFRPTRHG